MGALKNRELYSSSRNIEKKVLTYWAHVSISFFDVTLKSGKMAICQDSHMVYKLFWQFSLIFPRLRLPNRIYSFP